MEEYNKLSTDTKVKAKNNLLGGKARNDNAYDLREDIVREFNEELDTYAQKFNTIDIEVMNKGNFFAKHGDSYSYSGIKAQ